MKKRYKVKVQKNVILEREVEILANSESEVKMIDFNVYDSFKEVRSEYDVQSVTEINEPITGNRLVKIIDGTKTIPTSSVLEVSSIYKHGGGIWKITFTEHRAHIGIDRVRHLDGSKVIKKEFIYGMTRAPQDKDSGRLVIPTKDNKKKGVEYKPYVLISRKPFIVKDGNIVKDFNYNYDWVLYDDGNLTPNDYYTEQDFELYTDDKGIRIKKLNKIENDEV